MIIGGLLRHLLPHAGGQNEIRRASLIIFLARMPIIFTLPSMQHCQQVKYERVGTEITVEAKCTAPVGGLGCNAFQDRAKVELIDDPANNGQGEWALWNL